MDERARNCSGHDLNGAEILGIHLIILSSLLRLYQKLIASLSKGIIGVASIPFPMSSSLV